MNHPVPTYPRDCWYVAATSDEVGDGFLARRVADTSVVLFRLSDGSIVAFRPEENARRLNRSAERLALPQLPEELFLAAVRELVTIDVSAIRRARKPAPTSSEVAATYQQSRG